MDNGRDEAAFETLSQMTRQTREKFIHAIQALCTSDSATIAQNSKETLEDAFDRFQLWVGSVGASIASQRKISLEWRLRDAPEIKERIVELQSDLVEALDDLYAITTGQRDNRIRAADTVDLDPSSDSDADSVQLRFEVGAVNEAQDILDVVLECVKDLLRLSILIRKATPRDRWNRALQKPKDGHLDDRFDIRHVGDKFPKLCRPEHDWLRHRLGRAITQRRQFIRYCREHKNRMEELDIDNRIPAASRAGQSGLIAHNDVSGYAQTTTALTLNPPVTEGSTHASTLQVTTLEAIRGNEDGADSVATSVVSSLDPEDESEEMLRLPSLQTVSEGHDEFECPLCFTIQSFRQHRKWKKHAYSDLKPYVCCGGKGECDLELFSSRNMWFTHELENHRYHWICFLCQHEPLTSLARFQSHVQNKHVEIPVGQMLEVAQLCKRPLQYIPAVDCPFCDDFEVKLRERGGVTVGKEVVVVPAVIFRRHVAAHLEQLALFSLGPQNQPDEEMENGTIESRSDGSVRDVDVMEHFLNDQEEYEQDDPAPFSTGQDDLNYSTTIYSPPLIAASDRSYILETGDSHLSPLLDEDEEPEVREPPPRVLDIDNEYEKYTNSNGPSLLPSLLQVPGSRAREELAARLSQREEVVEQDAEQYITVPQTQEGLHCSDPRCDRKGDLSQKVWYCKSCASVLCDSCWERSPVHSGSSTSRHEKLTRAEMLDGLHQQQATQEIAELQSKLVLSSGKPVKLDFLDLSREVVHRGYLWRQGFASLRQWYVILLDNYFVFTEPQYIVKRPPIPMDLLVLESFDEPFTLDNPGKEGKQRLFPMRITHLGRETYTFLASSLDEWKTWCDKVVAAKTAHAASLHAQNAEPFRIRVLADSAFAYDSITHVQTPEIQAPVIKGTRLACALEDAEHFSNQEPVCKAKVNCATSYTVNENRSIVVGTKTGVYVIHYDMSPPQWMKVIAIPKVTQVAVLRAYSLLLILSDKSLIAYPLDVLHPHVKSDASKTAPQKLSGGRDIRFFNTFQMKGRDLVIYSTWQGLNSTFKVLEPVVQKSTAKSKSRLFGRSNRDMFRDFDEFYIPIMCSGINPFNATIAIHTEKGFEIMSLDKKQPWSVPDFKSPAVAEIANRLRSQTPLGMFRLDNQEFICCYDESAVYVNQHGDISRSVIVEYVGKANRATVKLGSLLLFHENFVEIRDVHNGRLKQIIEGKDIRCLEDENKEGWQTVKMVMRHPKNGQLQLVLELVDKGGD